jgi:hypothetical protein
MIRQPLRILPGTTSRAWRIPGLRNWTLFAAGLAACLGAPDARAQEASPAAVATLAPKGAENDRKTLESWGFKEAAPMAFDDHTGFERLFDGTSLKGWDGDPSVWRVENGAIVGESTKEKPVGNAYIVYRGSQPHDFDLKMEIKVEIGGGSGIQYRSRTGLPWRRAKEGSAPINLDWMMTGPQADFWYPVSPLFSSFSGQFYSENTPLGILALRGQVVVSPAGSKPRLVANIGDRNALGGYVRTSDWNEYLVMARGGTFIHVINGQLMAVYVDDDPASSNNQTGFIGIEIEGSPSRVSARNIWLRTLR